MSMHREVAPNVANGQRQPRVESRLSQSADAIDYAAQQFPNGKKKNQSDWGLSGGFLVKPKKFKVDI